MEVDFSISDNTLSVCLTGELDEHTATQARGMIDERLIHTAMNTVIFDLRGLSFMDSTGIGVLIGRYKLLRARGINVFIRGPKSGIDKVLNLTGIYAIMPRVE